MREFIEDKITSGAHNLDSVRFQAEGIQDRLITSKLNKTSSEKTYMGRRLITRSLLERHLDTLYIHAHVH